jgi:hypothetical protein
MKTSILRTLATLSLSAALGPVGLPAQTRGPIHVTVPFDFTAGSKSFTAGEYRVGEHVSNVLAIQSLDGKSQTLIMTDVAEASNMPGIAKFTFNKYGDHYFLSQVSDNKRGLELHKSAVEKELIAKKAPARSITLLAGR